MSAQNYYRFILFVLFYFPKCFAESKLSPSFRVAFKGHLHDPKQLSQALKLQEYIWQLPEAVLCDVYLEMKLFMSTQGEILV